MKVLKKIQMSEQIVEQRTINDGRSNKLSTKKVNFEIYLIIANKSFMVWEENKMTYCFNY